MKKLFAVLSVLVAFSVMAFAQEGTKKITDKVVTFEVPQDWEQFEVDGVQWFFYDPAGAEDGFADNFSVSEQKIPKGTKTKDFFSLVLKQLKKTFTKMEIIEQGEDYALYQATSESDGEEFVMIQRIKVIIKGTNSVSIYATSTPEVYADYEETFDEIFNSVKVK